jgi:hypothetical protein
VRWAEPGNGETHRMVPVCSPRIVP